MIGEGTSPFHSGIGYYNHETHCLGWNRGLNPLPLVLVDDVADAILLALDAPTASKANATISSAMSGLRRGSMFPR